MTDKEIIKGLEKELYHADYHDLDYEDNVPVSLLKNAYTLIIRQQAEIEKLKKKDEEYPFKCIVGNNSEIHSKTMKDYDRLISDISAEAIKEFAEKLKDGYSDIDERYEVILYDNLVCAIDDLVDEMVGAE